MSRDTIRDYWARRYSPHSTVVAVAGRIDHGSLVPMIEERFGAWGGDSIDRRLHEPNVEPRVAVRRRDTEQAHIVIGTPALSRADDRRFALTVVDHVLGGGMSSRLFHEIRETRGLVYAVHSFRLPFQETGALAIYVGTTPNQTDEVLKLVNDELEKIREHGLTEAELDRAKGHVKGALALSLEDANSRMNRLGRNELTGIEHFSVDEVVERIEAVDNAAVLEVAELVFGGPRVIGAVGPFDSEDLEEHVH
jgi:predicted Zn-dependent peptidase